MSGFSIFFCPLEALLVASLLCTRPWLSASRTLAAAAYLRLDIWPPGLPLACALSPWLRRHWATPEPLDICLSPALQALQNMFPLTRFLHFAMCALGLGDWSAPCSPMIDVSPTPPTSEAMPSLKLLLGPLMGQGGAALAQLRLGTLGEACDISKPHPGNGLITP